MNEQMLAFEKLYRNSVEVLKGPDDPRIWEIIAYMREYVWRGAKAKRNQIADPKIIPDPSAPPPALPRRTYRRV